MKRILLLISIFLLFSCSALAASFPDVAQDHENYYAIEYLKENEIIHGYEDGTFGPNNEVNRAEAVKIIVGAFNVAHDGEYEEIFPDVGDSEWFFSYVMGGYEASIIHGYDDGDFRPGNTVNLAETLKIIVLAADVDLPEDTDEQIFTDVLPDEWYAPHAQYASEHNVVLSDEEGRLNAGTPMTRAAFAEVIYRMMIVMENDGGAFLLHKHWPLYSSNVLPFKMKYDDNEWNIIEHSDEVIFFRPDSAASDFSPDRIYPNSGVVKVTLDENENELSREDYFQNIQEIFTGAEYTEFNWAEFKGLEVLYSNERTVDWYLYLDNGDVLVLFTEYGNGGYGRTLKKVIKAMLSTLTYNDEVDMSGDDYDVIVSEIFANILVEGKGMEMLDKLPDKVLFETDAIGVGTGPVDYYYSEEVDLSFKYERSADVILDKREGRTSSF